MEGTNAFVMSLFILGYVAIEVHVDIIPSRNLLSNNMKTDLNHLGIMGVGVQGQPEDFSNSCMKGKEKQAIYAVSPCSSRKCLMCW